MSENNESVKWVDASTLGIEGKGWPNTKCCYERLPKRAMNVVRDVIWDLSRSPAGISIHFRTNSPDIHIEWSLEDSDLSWPTMCAAGKSGFDLYGRDTNGQWRWAGVSGDINELNQMSTLLSGATPTARDYMLYLPLFNPVKELKIGVLEGAFIESVPARLTKPILVYGSSIVHGRAASRSGMAYPSMLGRRLDIPTINLGFSGNAYMEPELVEFLTDLDPCVYIIDAIPNMNAELIVERAEHFVGCIRKSRPNTPLILMEDRSYANSWICDKQRSHNAERRAAFRDVYRRLKESGYTDMHYLYGDTLLGSDDDACVDGSHPTDLGFYRLVDYLEPIVRAVL